MPRKPIEIWHRMPAKVQQEIIETFTSIFQEVIHEHIRTGQTRAHKQNGDHIYSAVESSSGFDEPGKLEDAIRPQTKSGGLGMAGSKH
ncbi:MAG TPA: hypothetical protein VE944_20415 [Nostoc sp.]|uniref:hypothetical protein n=1 Tax=Nostoc sp. TaxID=1180 RepID=UPI002D50A8BF|nr:hypothetical protein [Nostoc sp.]HYX16687.1 hypothetical protein [Nostoc sp.]